jgi:hypothetical protein
MAIELKPVDGNGVVFIISWTRSAGSKMGSISSSPLLDQIQRPRDLRKLSFDELH